MIAAAALTGGFRDPVFDSQAAFRAVLDAMASPGLVVPLPARTAPPPPLHPATATLLLTLADHDTPVFLDPAAAAGAVSAWLGFHCGARTTGVMGEAAFAVVSAAGAAPALSGFAPGTQEYPDRSTTVILQVERFDGPPVLRLAGPGIAGGAMLRATPLPRDFAGELARNRSRFPRGVDLVLAGPSAIVGLPRSVIATEAG